MSPIKEKTILEDSVLSKEALDKAASVAIKIISDASEAAAKKIASAADDAHKVVAAAAETSVRVLHLKSADDHDLLIELKTRMEGIKVDIKDLKDGVTKRIEDLETGKSDRTELRVVKNELENLSKEIHGDREKRMRSLENNRIKSWVIIGIYTILTLGLAGIMLAHVFHG